jgi:probable F420-dependent oxidoreductase
LARPFRFSVPMPRLDQAAARWRDEVRRIEDLGFSSISVSDHFTQGWVMEPIVAMTAAAEVTQRLRVLSLVFGNDYRHPVMLHKSMATLDVLSEGRVEIGLGAGWMLSDYDTANLAYDPAPVRVDRLEESAKVLKGLFGPTPYSLQGRHYRISGLEGLPKPVQRPHPPLLIGGGGKRVLSVAAQLADIVGINPGQRPDVISGKQLGVIVPSEVVDQTAERVDRKVGWVRTAATAAGRSMEGIELQIRLLSCHLSSSASDARASLVRISDELRVEPAVLEGSPALLHGSVEQCVEALQERRERFGISYVNLKGDVGKAARIVARLAGT